jgi:hypothetical protein
MITLVLQSDPRLNTEYLLGKSMSRFDRPCYLAPSGCDNTIPGSIYTAAARYRYSVQRDDSGSASRVGFDGA